MKETYTRYINVIWWSIVATGLVCYFVAFLRSIQILPGLSSQTIFPFFTPADVFADFFKLLHTYPSSQPLNLEPWLNPSLRQIIVDYLAAPSYSNNPLDAATRLTNFHSPPGATLIYIAIRKLSDVIGAATSLLLVGILLLAAGAKVVSSFLRKQIANPVVIVVVFLSLLSYPCLFAISRGHILSLCCLLLISWALLLALKNECRLIRLMVPLAMAISIRPNYLLLVPLFILIWSSTKQSRLQRRVENIFIASTLSGLIFLATFLLAHHFYPAYTLSSFTRAYSYYTAQWEMSGVGGGIEYSSSLLQLFIVIIGALHLDAPYVPILISIFRYFCMALGLFVCLLGYRRQFLGSASTESCLLTCILGIILATPLFSDYHLTILLLPLLCGCFRSCSSLSHHSIPTFSLGRLDLVVIAILMTGKAIPLSPLSAGSLQTFLNPLTIVIAIWASLRLAYSSRVNNC